MKLILLDKCFSHHQLSDLYNGFYLVKFCNIVWIPLDKGAICSKMFEIISLIVDTEYADCL